MNIDICTVCAWFVEARVALSISYPLRILPNNASSISLSLDPDFYYQMCSALSIHIEVYSLPLIVLIVIKSFIDYLLFITDFANVSRRYFL